MKKLISSLLVSFLISMLCAFPVFAEDYPDPKPERSQPKIISSNFSNIDKIIDKTFV